LKLHKTKMTKWLKLQAKHSFDFQNNKIEDVEQHKKTKVIMYFVLKS
jgi:hypothetical protein